MARGETTGSTETMAPKPTTMESRLNDRKEALGLKLGEEAKKRLLERCGAAQKKLDPLKAKDEQAHDNRSKKYNGILKRVEEMITRLNQQGVSTANLQTALTNYTSAIDEYIADVQTYKTTISDLSSMACDKDIEGFAATLSAARSAREKLKADGAVVRTAIAELKTALAEAKKSLDKPSGEAND